jgi:hypothetical protein
MFDPNTPLKDIPPDIRHAAAKIARTQRIVIQGFIPVDLLVETERRLFLTVIGELQNLREARPGFRCVCPSEDIHYLEGAAS